MTYFSFPKYNFALTFHLDTSIWTKSSASKTTTKKTTEIGRQNLSRATSWSTSQRMKTKLRRSKIWLQGKIEKRKSSNTRNEIISNNWLHFCFNWVIEAGFLNNHFFGTWNFPMKGGSRKILVEWIINFYILHLFASCIFSNGTFLTCLPNSPVGCNIR